ncbi:hypothetical protein L1049_012568 [Liquidambar formosana]|uniref:MATH domain-containing protein n=1 Tax=Liquidambar formosana TaxID=63359 RepID=A0AAP0R1W1_LIQFO
MGVVLHLAGGVFHERVTGAVVLRAARRGMSKRERVPDGVGIALVEISRIVRDNHVDGDGFATIGVTRSMRDVQPADNTLQNDSFSMLSDIFSERRVDRYESACFDAGGYKWRLSLYPNRDQKRDGNGHIPLYLVLAETDTFPVGLEVYVNFKYSNPSQIILDADGKISRFHQAKPEYGFSQLISLNAFHDASNGFLVDDSCMSGAEVFVITSKSKAECLIMIKGPFSCTTCEVHNFSVSDKECYASSDFIGGGTKWYV